MTEKKIENNKSYDYSAMLNTDKTSAESTVLKPHKTVYNCRICGKEFISIPEVMEHEQICAKESIEKAKKEKEQKEQTLNTTDSFLDKIRSLEKKRNDYLTENRQILDSQYQNRSKIININSKISALKDNIKKIYNCNDELIKQYQNNKEKINSLTIEIANYKLSTMTSTNKQNNSTNNSTKDSSSIKTDKIKKSSKINQSFGDLFIDLFSDLL